jgi:AcrR family transcriptional regulator
VHAPVTALRDSTEDPPARLRTWLHTLLAVKRQKVLADSELFAAYQRLAAEWQEALTATLDGLVEDIAGIVRDGVRAGRFRPVEPAETARAIFTATLAFHHPSHAASWSDPRTDERLDLVCDLILAGLAADPAGPADSADPADSRGTAG